VISVDTSVVVRYLVGSPPAQARRAATLIDDDAMKLGVSVVALAECAQVLRTQYDVDGRDILDALIGFIQRHNVRVLEVRGDLIAEALVRARSMPGRPIPDAFIVAASIATGALPMATFDRDQQRYGIAVREP
jgi:predicted nucleic acid-binding protein